MAEVGPVDSLPDSETSLDLMSTAKNASSNKTCNLFCYNGQATNVHQASLSEIPLNQDKPDLFSLIVVIDDDVYQALKRHFKRNGKGRPPDKPRELKLTNRLLLQLYFLKEEIQESFDQLKSWLEKLIPTTEDVTEGRIRHYINSLLRTSSTLLSVAECQDLLDVEFDFHALAGPLLALGLTRKHLMGTMKFSEQFDTISNEVVLALENFKSQSRETASFVCKWVGILSSDTKSLSQKQIRSRIEKVVSKVRAYQKNKKSDELKAYLEQPFYKANNDSSSTMETKENQHLKSKVHSLSNELRQHEKHNKMLKSDLEDSNKEVKKLEIQVGILTEESETNKHDKTELALKSLELKTTKKETQRLLCLTNDLQAEVQTLKGRRVYKQNRKLREEKAQLETKVEALDKELASLKSSATNQEINKLKRKVDNEQANKSKWRKKYKQLNESLVVDKGADEDQDDKEEDTITLREKTNNKFTSNVRLTYMQLQGEADVPATKCKRVVEIVSEQLHGKKLKGLPCTSSALNIADEAHHMAKQQIADKMLTCEHFTMASDGTSRQKQHYMERHITLDDGKVLSLGFTEIASDDAKTLLEQAVEVLEEITEIHCSTNSEVEGHSQEKTDEVMKEILKKMKAVMSDRAANMKAFNKALQEFKLERLGPDADATTIFLFCNAHFLLGLSTAGEKVCKDVEGEECGEGTTFGSRSLFFGQPSTLALIRCAAELFGPRPDEKSGCRQQWLQYCEKEGFKSLFCSFRSNRFNNIFDNASALIFHRDHVINFIENYCTHKNQKINDVHDALMDGRILSSVLAVALLNKLLTGPYWKLMESHKPYSSFPKYVQDISLSFQEWATVSEAKAIVQFKPAIEDFESQVSTYIDFPTELNSGDFCERLFLKTFVKLIKEMDIVLRRQLQEFLDDGIFAGDLPQEVKEILDKCPLTNLTGERLFGDFDYDINKRRHATTHHRSTINMWKHNHTIKWFNTKSATDKSRILKSSQKFGRSLRMEHNEAVKREKTKILKLIEENEKKKNEKALSDLAQRNKVLDSVLENGFWSTLEEIDEKASLEDLKNQLRYRKLFLQEKNIRVSGTKVQLIDLLRKCIDSNSNLQSNK